MATDRLPMRTIREILRLKAVAQRSHREVARSLGISAGTVASVVGRARLTGVTWAQVETLSDDDLDRTLYGPPAGAVADEGRPEPDVVYLHRELRRPGVTLELLHVEYLAQHQPQGWVVDMQHYLDEETGDLPDQLPSRILNLALFFGSIVAWVTDHLPEGDRHTNVPCRRSPGRKRCRGEIIAELNGASGYIEWRCMVCGDNGMIHGWEDTLWNRSSGSPTPPETEPPPTSH